MMANANKQSRKIITIKIPPGKISHLKFNTVDIVAQKMS